MFELWKLRREIRATRRSFARDRKILVKRNAPRDDFLPLDANEHFLVQVDEQAIDTLISSRLLDEARKLDVEIPLLSEQEMWVNIAHEDSFLTAKGRSRVRKLIDEEKARRFDVKTLWVMKFWLPLILALAGLLGAATGFVLALKK